MRKTIKRLSITAETVRVLGDSNLGRVAGGEAPGGSLTQSDYDSCMSCRTCPSQRTRCGTWSVLPCQDCY